MNVAVAYEHVTFSYNGAATGDDRSPVLEDVTLNVGEGERLGVLGPNGGGKSTLIKLTLGLFTGYEGRISVFGLSPHEARRRRLIGYVPQRSEAELAFPLSARQVIELGVSLGVAPWRAIPPDRRAAVEDALKMTGVDSFADQPIGRLSGGQVQRVMVARALALRPRLLLLDEPTVGIDPAGQQQFAQFLGSLVRQWGLTVIVVSHDLRTIAAGCDRVACLSRTLHSHTAPAGLTPQVLAEVFRHDVAAVFGDLHVDAHAATSCADPAHKPHHNH